MLPFTIQFQSGKAVYEQVLLAVKRALTVGQLKAGDRFPSVRVLSQELRINPNTAHKIVSALADEGLLIIQPGVGTVVAQIKPPTPQQKQELIEQEIERLVVEARFASLDLEDLLPAIKQTWQRLTKERR